MAATNKQYEVLIKDIHCNMYIVLAVANYSINAPPSVTTNNIFNPMHHPHPLQRRLEVRVLLSGG